MASREILAGAVLELNERDEAVALLRRTLDLEWIGGQGQHKTDIRAFFSRLGIPQVITRFDRQRAIEKSIVAFNPDTVEALELLHAVERALKDRYGEDKTIDFCQAMNAAQEALSELEGVEYSEAFARSKQR